MDVDESFKSPELQRLEDEVKLMEAEMDAAHQELEQLSPKVDSNCDESECDDFFETITISLSPRELSPSTPIQIESTATPTIVPSPSSYSSALKTLAFILVSAPRSLNLAFAVFILSVIAQMYPTSPQSGCYISLLLALFQIKSVSWRDKGKMHIVSLVSCVVITIIFDIDWLISSYFVQSLGENEDFEFKLTQRASFVWQLSWWAVATNVFVKIIATNDCINAWGLLRGYYFMSNGKDIYKPVSKKVILVTWVELISSLLLFVYFFLVQFDVVQGRMNVFNDAPIQLLSVQATLLFKGTSGIIVFLSFVHHIKIRDLCAECTCFRVEESREIRRNRKKIVKSLVTSLNCITYTKATDFLVGVMLWISLANALSNIQFDAPKDTKILLILMSVTSSFTSLTPLLVTSIVGSIRLSEKQREEARHEGMDGNTPHRSSSRRARRRDIRSVDRWSVESPHTSDNDSYDFASPNVSQSLFSTRLEAASPFVSTLQQRTHSETSFELDFNLYCTPREFESEWQSLSSCRCVEEHHISRIPSQTECNLHFNRVGWFIIASGVVENVTKMFLIAQRRIQTPVKGRNDVTPPHHSESFSSSRCLVQMSFFVDAFMNSMMTLDVRSRNEDDIDSFTASLELIDLLNAA